MKIKRDEDKKKPKTPEEEELSEYKRAKNIGLAALGTGAAFLGTSRAGRKFNENLKKIAEKNLKEGKPAPTTEPIRDRDIKISKAAGIGLGIAGLGLHGISAVKHRKLKKKLQKEKEADDNTKEEK